MESNVESFDFSGKNQEKCHFSSADMLKTKDLLPGLPLMAVSLLDYFIIDFLDCI